MAVPALKPSTSLLFSLVFVVIILPSFCHAFGAGNIQSVSRIEGMNWRHGDIEDTLLSLLMARSAGGRKFTKMDVKRVYFGNWLRDYSQAVDVGTVKSVSAEAIRIILWVLGFLTFGYGTKEFEVTTERLGCYRPEEHIDNPKDYADNVDARQYDPRLRPPLDEQRELGIDPRNGLKAYIASEDYGIATSAGFVRWIFGRSIQLGRSFAKTKNNAELYEALRLLGTGCHCLEDFSAHSNYTELALFEMGEQEVFPHVGRRTAVQVHGVDRPVWPIVTGTFGGVDFFHSVLGELSDKATQSEVEQLDGTLASSQNQGNTSLIKDLLAQLPKGLFGGKDHAAEADNLQANAAAQQMSQTHISPKRPEAWTQQLNEVAKQIYPTLQWHDEIMQSISQAIQNIPLLPQLIEQLQDQISIFVFSIISPFVLPIIRQVKQELATGSEEVIGSSKNQQLIVFHNDRSDNPTHSMLSKDHFTNVLNAPAGRIASEVLKWVVPQLMECWDDERIDPNRTITRIINGVFHHPALRGYGDDGAVDCRNIMFSTVEKWWRELRDDDRNNLRFALSRKGVETGRNHNQTVHDTGHGSCKPLALPKLHASSSGGFTNVSEFASQAVGGGALGGVVGGVVGGLVAGETSSLLGDALGPSGKTNKYQQNGYNADGSFTNTLLETGYGPPAGGAGHHQHAQAQYQTTSYNDGSKWEQYSRYEQAGHGGHGYGYEESVATHPRPDGGYDQYTERRHHHPGGRWQSEVHEQRYGADAQLEYETRSKHKGKKGHGKKHKKHKDYDSGGESEDSGASGGNDYSEEESEGSGSGDDDYKKQAKKMKKKEKKKQKNKQKSDDDDDDDYSSGGSGGGGRGRGGRMRGGRGGGGRGGRRRSGS